jgi:HK97 family phage prohead protease
VRETKAGLEITGELVMQTSKAQEGYALMKKGVLKGLSIGFDVVRDTVTNGIRHLHELKLYEVSVVTFPMNGLATVSSVKSDDPVANFRARVAECSKKFECR